ncbi:MAG: response regulator, partial [Caldilineaceae bacterium]|nr:response regulator [Caldilineaceae bacterium]
IRTPMNGVVGMADLLAETDLDDDQQLYADTIRSSGEALLVILNDVLDYSKIESGMFELFPEPFDLERAVHDVALLLQPKAREKGVDLLIDYDMFLPAHYIGDGGRLRQVLTNLAGNAVKFTDTGFVLIRVVGIEVAAGQQKIHIAIEDSGIGIAADQIEQLFQPFVQLDSSYTRQHSGTGLGLSLVRRLSELHGGSVSVDSEVGVGSCFKVSLPWEDDGSSQAEHRSLETVSTLGETQAAAPESPKSSSILIVDDNEINLALLNEYLSHSGYRLTLARSGQECIERFEEDHYDLILMDVQMPGMDGLEATLRIRQTARGAHVPIIALTALAMPGDYQRCIDAGMNDYVTKPLPLRKLKKMIADYLGLGD